MGTPRLLHLIHPLLVSQWSLRSVLVPDSVVQQAGVLVRSWCECRSCCVLLRECVNGPVNSRESKYVTKNCAGFVACSFSTCSKQCGLGAFCLQHMNFDSLRGAPEALHIVDSKGISCVTCEGSWRRSIYEASSEDMSCHHGNQFPNFIWKSWTWSFFRPK